MSSSDIVSLVVRCIDDDKVTVNPDQSTLDEVTAEAKKKGVLPAFVLLSTVVDADPEVIFSLSFEKWGCTNKDAEYLATFLGKCTGLEYLNLTGNEISEDGVRALAPALGECTNLNTLLLDSNPLGAAGAAVLAESALPRLNSLGTLFMDRTDLGDEGASAVIRALPLSTKLVSLSGNRLTDSVVKVLAAVLPSRPSMTHLFLKRNEITDAGAKVLSDVVDDKCQSMYSVALTNNNLTAAGCAYLLCQMGRCPRCSFTFDECPERADTNDALLKKYSVFHVMVAVENALDTSHTSSRSGSWDTILCDLDGMHELVGKAQRENRDPVISVVAEALGRCSDVKTMVLPQLEVDRDDAALLGGAMSECPSLEKAVLSNVIFQNGALLEFLEQLKKSRKIAKLKLASLHIAQVNITSSDADVLCTLLPQLKNLNELSLQRCKPTSEISRRIFAALSSCLILESFEYSGNALSHEEVSMLQAGINKKTLALLELEECELSDEDALTLLGLVEQCPKMKRISLKDNKFTQAGLAALRKASSNDTRCTYSF